MRIIAAPGCFDGCHAGHRSLLERARALGDWLVVLLPTDEVVRQLKGPGRPLATWEQRRAALMRLPYVDAVIRQTTLTPRDLLQELEPFALVKGQGSGPTEGAEFCESVIMLELLPGYSTTELSRVG